MNTLLNFAFDNELVRVVSKDGEPWFVGADVCRCLELTKNTSLDALDDDEKDTHSMGTLGGPQTMIVISEPGLYRLVFTSRKPIAEKFKRWLAHEVIPAIRKTGRYEVPRPKETAPMCDNIDAWREKALNDPRFAVQMVGRAQSLYGKTRARLVWDMLGLPEVPKPIEPAPIESGFACLAHFLSFEIEAGLFVRDLLEAALDGDEDSAASLQKKGIRIRDNPDGFFIANSHPGVQEVFLETAWRKGQFRHVLRQLPGAQGGINMRFGYDVHKGIFLPECYLDERLSRRAS